MAKEKTSPYKNYTDAQINKIIVDEWLGLGDEIIDLEQSITNPLLNRSQADIDNPHLFLLKLMMNPEYFPFAAKHIFNVKIPPFQNVILNNLWFHSRPMLIGTRGLSKTYMLAVHALRTALFKPGSKIVITAAAFRQAKYVFDYCETIWSGAPVLRSMIEGKGRTGKKNGPARNVDRCDFTIGDSQIICLPTGDGSKIRGQRGTCIIVEEFGSLNEIIYEKVIQPFGAVSASPVEAMIQESKVAAMKRMGFWTEQQEIEFAQNKRSKTNQCIISGTCDFAFKHFAKYWRKHKSIIESRGDKEKLRSIVGEEYADNIDYRDYCIIQVPVELVPPGFMDKKTVANAKATYDPMIYLCEYGARFCTDSQGFFRRSLLESCVCNEPIPFPSGPAQFNARIFGDASRKYVYGIDPASESDNFAIVILEMWPDHRRIVHCWTLNKDLHSERLKQNLTTNHDFYDYCCRKIRDLMKYFPCERIICDSQGGGVAIREALHSLSKLEEGELPIWEIFSDDPSKPKDTDRYPGLHILEMANFSDANWMSEANHGMRKDFMNKLLLFPMYDATSLEFALLDDKAAGRVIIKDGKELQLFDTMEDCILEIEEIKRELTTIVHGTVGSSGRERWDTPELKNMVSGVPRKGRLRKDRYSALLLANMAGRQMQTIRPNVQRNMSGGFATQLTGKKKHEQSSGYSGSPMASKLNSKGGVIGIRRGV